MHDDDVGLGDLPCSGAGDQALAHDLADLDVVEADVVVAAPAERQPVVVDDGLTPWDLA